MMVCPHNGILLSNENKRKKAKTQKLTVGNLGRWLVSTVSAMQAGGSEF